MSKNFRAYMRKADTELYNAQIVADLYGYDIDADKRYIDLCAYITSCEIVKADPDLFRLLDIIKDILLDIIQGW